MAGGVGSRFWPVSTESFPKQFHDMLGTGDTLLQKTFKRLSNVIPKENIFILTNRRYNDLVFKQLPMVAKRQVVLEPAMRNTAPCILYASLKIQKENDNALVIVAPSDHWIEDENAFKKNVEQAFEFCKNNDALMTLGIVPTFPNTGYGYIEYNDSSKNDVKSVIQFREKPDLSLAKSFIEQGNFYWNSGMFVWKSTTIMNSFKNHSNELYTIFFEDLRSYNSQMEDDFLNEAFMKCEDISIDYAILEKEADTSVVLSTFDWSDLGTWGSLKDLLEKDENKNSQNNKEVYFFDSKNCLVKTSANKTTIIDGLDNYIIIDTDDKLMILKGENEQELKSYLKIINQN